MVVVNLYPFEKVTQKANVKLEEAIENIDIGGPSMIRSAAKNHAHVAVVTAPVQYARVEAELTQYQGCTTGVLREHLAAEAFALTSRYDASITAYLTRSGDTLFPPVLGLSLVKTDDLRYGENPHQKAAMYRHRVKDGSRFGTGPSIATTEQLHGKELSYNNINDAAATLELALAMKRVDPSRVGACVVKHTNPCGSALASSVRDAVDLAIAGDPLAAYGGIIAINEVVDEAAAERLCDELRLMPAEALVRFDVLLGLELRLEEAVVALLPDEEQEALEEEAQRMLRRERRGADAAAARRARTRAYRALLEVPPLS
jgi:phosphoribosylaminoimidazolecarboxamide formyltransferase/IMP cyclohydrolase